MTSPMLRELFRPRVVSDFPGPMARKARQVADQLRAAWDRSWRSAVETGRLDDLHETRDQYHALLHGHLQFLGQYRAVAELHRRMLGSNPVWVEELSRAESDLRCFYEELFPRWQTAQDLCELLAERVVRAAGVPAVQGSVAAPDEADAAIAVD